MASKSSFIIICIAIALMESGCGWWNTAFRVLNVDDGSGAMVDIKQRAIIVSKQKRKSEPTTIVCAEPSPDAMSAYAAEVAGKINAFGKVNSELTTAFQEGVAYTGLRTQSIQLLRDSFYRLCEGYMSGALEERKYDTLMRRYQKNMVALLAIEQLTGAIRVPPVVVNTEGRAEIAASISKLRKEAKRIKLEIEAKTKEKTALEAEIERLPADHPQRVHLGQQVTNLQKEITDLETDLEKIDESIKSARGMMASGSTTAIVSAPANLNDRNDDHIAAVANVIERIVEQILNPRDVDDITQFCLGLPHSRTKVAPLVLDACLDSWRAQAEQIKQVIELVPGEDIGTEEKATLIQELRQTTNTIHTIEKNIRAKNKPQEEKKPSEEVKPQ